MLQSLLPLHPNVVELPPVMLRGQSTVSRTWSHLAQTYPIKGRFGIDVCGLLANVIRTVFSDFLYSLQNDVTLSLMKESKDVMNVSLMGSTPAAFTSTPVITLRSEIDRSHEGLLPFRT